MQNPELHAEEENQMTDAQKEAIKTLRLEGWSYGKVTEKTGIKYEAVKSFCRRNGLAGKGIKRIEDINGRYEFCLNCGTTLIQREHTKRRVFCCKPCREKWWHEHSDKLKKKAVYHFICAHCGKPFTAYGNSGRKYCSHECYIEERFGGEAVNE